MSGTGISTVDLVIIGAYFIVVFAIGLYVASKTKTSDDLFLGGRTLTWGFIGLSLFASNISTSTIMGLSGAAYNTGIATSVYEWMSGLPLVVAALVFIPLYLKSRITTIPEFLLHRFDRRSQVFFSVATIIASIVVETAGGLYAGAIVLKTYFPGLEIWYTALALAAIAGIYTAMGGLKAVVYTDALQAVILVIGCSILTYMLFEKLDFSWETVTSATPADHFSVVRPLDDEALPWPGIFLGVFFLGFWYWSTNQYIVQRVLGAKDIQHARWGVVLAGFLKIIPLFIMVVPGAMAITLFPGLEDGDMVFPTAVTNILPIGLVGLVLAGLISAIMSSVDSTLNSASTLIVVDFIKPAKPDITEKEVGTYGRVATLVLMVIGASCAPIIGSFDGIWDYLQKMYSIFVPPVVVLFLVGVFYKRGNGNGAFWTLMLGTALGILFFVLELVGIWTIHFTITAGITIGISSLIFLLVSRLSEPPSAEVIERFTFHKSMIHEGTEGLPWYKNYLYQIYLLLAVIAGILIALW